MAGNIIRALQAEAITLPPHEETQKLSCGLASYGRALIANDLIHSGAPTTGPVSPAPSVTIGAVDASNSPVRSAVGSEPHLPEVLPNRVCRSPNPWLA